MFGLNKPKVLEEVESKFSGTLTVTEGYGTRYVSTGMWTQSGGIITDVWSPVLKKLKNPKNKSWLVLGLATGTVAHMISKKYQPTKIVGVEIDPEMIHIGKKYFDLDKIPNLEIVNKDASDLSFDIGLFDITLVDMYLGDQLPKFVYSQKFIKSLPGDVIVFNHLFYTNMQKENAQKLVDILKKNYSKIQLVRVLTNLMIICS